MAYLIGQERKANDNHPVTL